MKKAQISGIARFGGVLLHPVSLPGKYPVGDIGPEAYRFVDFLSLAGQTLWQILPIGPTGYGDSPYASLSSFAGNPLLVSLDQLEERGLVTKEEIADLCAEPWGFSDYSAAWTRKLPLLRRGAERFLERNSKGEQEEYRRFTRENSFWLPDFSLFMAVKEHFDAKAATAGAPTSLWNLFWDRDIARKEPTAVASWKNTLTREAEIHAVIQFFFHSQWLKLKRYANERGIKIIGDIPIFVAQDSADLWSRRDLFQVDAEGNPLFVAGVPPDYFSSTGQLWGNPLYDWGACAREKFAWWIERVRKALSFVDILRIDHFRGFVACWQVKGGAKTAEKGKWVKTPGAELFTALRDALGIDLPIIAEDLGVITPAVERLRDRFGLPGMKILQFAFEPHRDSPEIPNPENKFLPHNHIENCVVYTGTHDNDTTVGWYSGLAPELRDIVRKYFERDDREIPWEMIRTAYASVARYAVVPMQDLLLRGTDARMNTPSTACGNWRWRFSWEDVPEWLPAKIREMALFYGRCAPPARSSPEGELFPEEVRVPRTGST